MSNVTISKVDTGILSGALAALALKPKDGTPEAMVTALEDFYRAHKDDYQFAHCDDCGGHSDAALPACPYCGSGEPVDGLAVDEAAVAAAVAETPAEEPPAPETPADTPADTAAAAPASKKKSKKKKKKKATKETAAAKPPAEPKPGAPSKAGPSKKKTSAKKTTPKAAKPPKNEIVPTATTDVTYTIDDLERECAAIRDGTLEAAGSLWAVGVAFKRIHDSAIWKLREDGDGNLVHTNFKAFCASEFGISYTYAFQLMEVSDRFTRDQVMKLGVSKLKLVMSVPTDRQQDMINAAENGATVNDLNDEARDIRESGGKATPPKPPAGSGVTMAILQGVHEVTAYKRPTTAGAANDEPVPATTHTDDPWCVLPLANDVKLYVRMSATPDGELVFLIEAKRQKGKI